MGVEPQNPLQFPHRGDFRQDDDAHQRNLDHLERWANGPKDWVLLVNHEELPRADEFPEGALVQANGEIFRKRGQGFQPLVPEANNDFVMSWSFTGDLTAATDFLDTHPLNIPYDGVLTKAYVVSDPALATGETIVVDLRSADGTVFFEFTLDGDENGGKVRERLKLGVQEDEELYVNVLSDTDLTEHSLTMHLSLQKV